MTASARSLDATTRDLQAERANALGRASDRLEAALAELAEADAALAANPSELRRLAREEALAEAGERLWFLVIQREALGLARHDVVYEVFKVPRTVRAAMGPRRG
jgi:hypothetical protein